MKLRNLFRRADRPGGRDDSERKAGLRLGIVGPGLIWHKKHRSELEKHGSRVKVEAICARTQETLDAAALPNARKYTQIEALLRDDEVDVVMVLTPIGLNASTTVAALEAGKHVFVEKPLGRNLEECNAVLRAEAESGKRVYVLEQAVYNADIATTQRLLAENSIGDLVLYDRITHFQLDADKHDAGGFGKTAWRIECDFPLGALLDGGIHPISQLTRLFGVPENVLATGRKWREHFGEFDEVLMQFSYGSGLRGVFSHASALPTIHCGFNIRGTKGVIRPEGATVKITNLDDQTKEIPPEAAAPDMWEQILSAYEAGVLPPYTAVDAAQDVAILDAVSESLGSGLPAPIKRIAKQRSA